MAIRHRHGRHRGCRPWHRTRPATPAGDRPGSRCPARRSCWCGPCSRSTYPQTFSWGHADERDLVDPGHQLTSVRAGVPRRVRSGRLRRRLGRARRNRARHVGAARRRVRIPCRRSRRDAGAGRRAVRLRRRPRRRTARSGHRRLPSSGSASSTTATLRWYHAEAWPRPTSPVMATLAGGDWHSASWSRSSPASSGHGLPGADAAPLYETSGGGGGVTQIVSPLVDIRSRLTNRSTTELFRVRADAESYWRSSALPEFDGTTWGLPERELQSVDGALDRSGGVDVREPPTDHDRSVRRHPGSGRSRSLPGLTAEGHQFGSPRPQHWSRVGDDLADRRHDRHRLGLTRTRSAAAGCATSDAAPDPIHTSCARRPPRRGRGRPHVQVTAGATSTYDAALQLQAWFRGRVRVQPRGATRSRQLGDRELPGAIVSATANSSPARTPPCCERSAFPHACRRRVHVGRPPRRRGVLGARPKCPRLARGVVRRHRLGRRSSRPRAEALRTHESYTGLAPQQDTSAGADEIEEATDAAPLPTAAAGPIDPDGRTEHPGLRRPRQATRRRRAAGGTAADGAADVPRCGSSCSSLLGAALAAPGAVRFVRRRRRTRSVDEQLADAWQRATSAVIGRRRSGAALGHPDRDRSQHRAPLPAGHAADGIARRRRDRGDLSRRRERRIRRRRARTERAPSATVGNWAKQIDRAATESLDWPRSGPAVLHPWR